MATSPFPPQQRVVVSQTSNTQGAVNTVKTQNSQSAENQLVFTLENTTAADIANVVIFPGADDVGTLLDMPNGITMTVEGFASRAAMLGYFKQVRTNLEGIELETNNIDNYIGSLVSKETYPNGRNIKTPFRLRKYRTPLGNDYAKTLRIPATALRYVLWPGLRLEISNVKANSEITFTCNTIGVNKSGEFSDIPTETIQ